MRHDVRLEELGELRILAASAFDPLVGRRARRERRRGEIGGDALDLFGRQFERRAAARREFSLDRLAQRLEALLVQQDLDARLVLVVAPAFEIVDAQDRLGIGEQITLRQEIARLVADERRAAEPAADIDGEAELARVVAHDLQADVVRLDDGAVVRRAVDGDLELARQERELGVQRRPLPQDFGERARIGEFVGGDAGVVVGGDVANAVS